MRDKELLKGPWKSVNVESQASLLHPLPSPCGGVIVVGYETISYYNKDVQHAIDPPTVKVSVSGEIYYLRWISIPLIFHGKVCGM